MELSLTHTGKGRASAQQQLRGWNNGGRGGGGVERPAWRKEPGAGEKREYFGIHSG